MAKKNNFEFMMHMNLLKWIILILDQIFRENRCKYLKENYNNHTKFSVFDFSEETEYNEKTKM